MIGVGLPTALIASLNPANVGYFLHRSGWKRQAFRDGLDLYERGGAEILVPTRRSGDYTELLASVLGTVSAVDDQAPYDVALQMLATCDVVRVRLATKETVAGDMAISTFGRLMDGIKSLLVGAAFAELPGIVKTTDRARRAKALAEATHVGQTDFGSFSISFSFPLPHLVKHGEVPTYRRVTERVMRGMSHVADAVAEDDVQAIVSGTDVGLNAQMCDAVAFMMGVVSDGSAEFRASFDPGWGPTDNGEPVPTRATLRPRARGMVQKAATVLRNTLQAVSTPNEIEAWVVGSRYEGAHGRRKRDPRITLLYTHKNWGMVAATATVSEPQYWLALEAHRKDCPVRFSGILTRSGGSWVVHDVRDIQLVPPKLSGS